MTLPGPSEREFQAQVVELAKMCGWLCFHTLDSRGCTAGFPDLLMIRGCVLVVAELKVGKRKPTPAQKQWLEAFGEVGHAFLWTPNDWQTIESVLMKR